MWNRETDKRILGAVALLIGMAVLMAETNLGPILTTYNDAIGSVSSPGNPASGNCRSYFNTTTGVMTYLNSSGSSCGGGNSGAGLFATVFPDFANGNLFSYGASVEAPSAAASGGSCAVSAPTSTSNTGFNCLSGSAASTNTVIGMEQGDGANYGDYSFGGIYNWSHRWAAGNTANVRYWMGITVFYTSGSGCETAHPYGTSCFAANSPNRSTLGFRYSVGTDTSWAAVAQVTGGGQTVVATGKALDTNLHVFQLASNGTTVTYSIDGTLVATINTNVPPPSTYRVMQFWTGDNENTATAVGATEYWMSLSMQ
jgi:hypothetical protein